MLLTTLKAIWTKAWGYVALAGVVLAGLLAVRQSGKVAGRREVEVSKLRAQVRAREISREAAADIESMDDAAVRDRARQRMRKSVR